MSLNSTEKHKLNEFLSENISAYSIFVQKFLIEQFDSNKAYTLDFINQIYAYLFPYKKNIYGDFVEFLLEKFPDIAKRNILEVASGYIPGLSIVLRKMLDMKNNITCMDPNAISLEIPGIELKKEEFSLKTNTLPYDLIISHYPCGALDNIIEQSIANMTEMCIQTCPYGNGSPLYTFAEFDYYIKKVLDRLSILEDDGFIIECEKIDSYLITHSPVITVRKRVK